MAADSLRQWYIYYVKNRDLMLKKIASIKDDANNIIITNKDGTEETSILDESPSSFSKLLEGFKKDARLKIVTLNKKDAIRLLIEEWAKLIEYASLTMMFVNPHSHGEHKWIIKPHIHAKFTDKSTLKPGIMSIAGTVEFL